MTSLAATSLTGAGAGAGGGGACSDSPPADQPPMPYARMPYARMPYARWADQQQEAGPEDLTVADVADVADPLEITPAVDVQVLGPVRIGGAAIRRGKSRELVVVLAMHPAGMITDQLWEALWPETSPVPATLHSTTSVARAALGVAADGSPRLLYAHGGIYRLHRSVGLDAARFAALAARGQAGGAKGIADLRRALELVRGEPFAATGPRSYQWAVPHRFLLAAEIAETAMLLGQLCLEAGDYRGAQWAGRRGLLVNRYDERLYQLLMLAADIAGNPLGVRAVWAELNQVLEVDEPQACLHPRTIEVYQRLRRR